jgi:hypothetical protein
MLRLFVLTLLLANGVYYAWSAGLLRAYGYAPVVQHEPQRLTLQIQPEVLRILTNIEQKKAEAPVVEQVARECVVAGPFDKSQVPVLRRALEASLPSGTWQLDSVAYPARWIVYMGKFVDAQAVAKKRSELLALRLSPQSLYNPDLELGISLGGFDSQDEAAAELARLNQRGIRTARVVQERVAGPAIQLKLPALPSNLKPQLNELKPALAGRALVRCG